MEGTAMLSDYIACALWSCTDNSDDTGGEPLDANYSADDLAPETSATMQAELDDFAALVASEGIDRSWWDDSQFAHDFWLTRNRHGAGFWDRGQGAIGDRLTALAHPYGEAHLYVGDDGLIYQA
jgi:hypothetical protein